jgi:hypothetical protein
MRTQRTLLLIALFAAGQAVAQQTVAQQTVANPSVSKIPTSTEQKFYRLVPARTVESRGGLNRDGDLNTQAWTTVAGWYPGRSAFPDAEIYTWQLPLLSIGHEP